MGPITWSSPITTTAVRTRLATSLATWRSRFGLVAGLTTRGESHGDCSFALRGSDPADEAWRALGAAFDPEFTGMAVARQVHGNKIAEHPARFDGRVVVDGYDGHMTLEPGLLLAITVADCVPVYLADPETGGIALIHAGWRGIVAGIVERGIDRLSELTGGPASRFLMHCGVAISGSRYEVGPEVVAQLGLGPPPGGRNVDLREVLASRARSVGVKRITMSPWCTFRDSDLFFSYRREREMTGRMIAYLGRPLT